MGKHIAIRERARRSSTDPSERLLFAATARLLDAGHGVDISVWRAVRVTDIPRGEDR
jgi:hypothetical protein